MSKPVKVFCPECGNKVSVERSFFMIVCALVEPEWLDPIVDDTMEVDDYEPLSKCGEFRCHDCGAVLAETREEMRKLIDKETE